MTGAWPVAAAIGFRLAITFENGRQVRRIRLRAQVSVRSHQRHYTAIEAAGLEDLFGAPGRWAETLAPLPWAEGNVEEGTFRGRTEAGLVLPCGTETAVSKYFAALEGGTAPLLFLFRGWIWYGGGRTTQVAPIPWDREARFQLPVCVWRQAAGVEPVAAAIVEEKDGL